MNQAAQQDYYNRTASNYDAMHLVETGHEIALAQLSGMARYFKCGAATGRVIHHSLEQMPASIHLMNTKDGSSNLLCSASHISTFAVGHEKSLAYRSSC